MTSKRLRVSLEGAIFAALAIVLSLLPTNIGSGFTVSLGMIPLTIYSIRHGVKAGLAAGFLWGILHFVTGDLYVLSVPQALIEYFIAFVFAGFAGFQKNKVAAALASNNKTKLEVSLVVATFYGTFARFFWHFLAGVIFWGSYAMWGLGPVMYSLVMNGASALATAIATSLVLVAIGAKFPAVFVSQD